MSFPTVSLPFQGRENMQYQPALNQNSACVPRLEIGDPFQAPTPETPPAAQRSAIPQGSETILLVDDEAIIRDMAGDLLRRLGYTVHVAADGLAALERFRELHGEIGAVLLDFAMPRMGGIECLKKLKELQPDIRILVSSGYDITSELRKLQLQGAWGFIQKPFRFSELAQSIRAVLDA